MHISIVLAGLLAASEGLCGPISRRYERVRRQLNSPIETPEDPTAMVVASEIGTDLPIGRGYNGAPASGVQRELVGPVTLLRSARVDTENDTLTIPLYFGVSASNGSYWWIATDSSDEGNAEQLGLNFAPKLRFAAQGATPGGLKAAEQVELVNNAVQGRRGMVDFSPVRSVVPGNESAFPPSSFAAGSVGDEEYTPLLQLTNGGGEVWNAPIIAGDVTAEYLNSFCDGVPEDRAEEFYSRVHDQVVAICPEAQLVTLSAVRGFSFSKPVLYLVTEASDELPAALDGTTHAPRLEAIRTGQDDAIFSSVERIFVSTNGYTNEDLAEGAPNGATNHPQRQGLSSAVLGEGTLFESSFVSSPSPVLCPSIIPSS